MCCGSCRFNSNTNMIVTHEGLIAESWKDQSTRLQCHLEQSLAVSRWVDGLWWSGPQYWSCAVCSWRLRKIPFSEQPLTSIIWSKPTKCRSAINQRIIDHIGESSVRTNHCSNLCLHCGTREREEICLVFLWAFEQTTFLWWVLQANHFFTKSFYRHRVQYLLLVWVQENRRVTFLWWNSQ